MTRLAVPLARERRLGGHDGTNETIPFGTQDTSSMALGTAAQLTYVHVYQGVFERKTSSKFETSIAVFCVDCSLCLSARPGAI